MDNPASLVDLTDRGWVGDNMVGTAWLNVTWRALRREVPSIAARIESGELDTQDVVDVVVSAALRVLRNPDGAESESGQLDDYSESIKYADATRDVYFTAAELRRLAPVDTLAGGWSGSVKYA